MSCQTKPGPAAFCVFIEATTGERISQQDWHDVRRLAAAEGMDTSRRHASTEDINTVLEELAHDVDAARHSQPLPDAEAFYRTYDTMDQQGIAEAALDGEVVTEGTLSVVQYLSAHGVKDTLAKVRAARIPFTPPADAEAARGNTLFMVERNGYDDSDFSGMFYDPKSGKFGWATTGSTSYGGGFIPQPDASDDIVARYREAYATARADYDARIADWESRVPDIGKTVRVDEHAEGSTRKRKNGGREGTVVWHGRDDYKSSELVDRFRIGIQPDDGGDVFYVPADYVKVQRNGEWVQAEGTSKTTGAHSTTGMTGGQIIGYGFAQQWPDPDDVEARCRAGRAD